MRYSALAVIGIAGLLVMGGLRLSGGKADAQQTPKSGRHTFAEYAGDALKVGVQVNLRKSFSGAGYSIMVLSKSQGETFEEVCSTVKEIGPDYVVFRQKSDKVSVETVVPFRAIASIERYVETDSN